MDIHSSGGGMGGRKKFSERTMLVYTFSHMNDHATLGSIVILRSAGPICELKPDSPVRRDALRKLVRDRCRAPGSGSSGIVCGPHYVHLDRPKHTVLLDFNREIALGNHNVLLLDNIDAPCSEVTIAGIDKIAIDVSREYLVRRAIMDGYDMDRKVAEGLMQLPSVRNFCS